MASLICLALVKIWYFISLIWALYQQVFNTVVYCWKISASRLLEHDPMSASVDLTEETKNCTHLNWLSNNMSRLCQDGYISLERKKPSLAIIITPTMLINESLQILSFKSRLKYPLKTIWDYKRKFTHNKVICRSHFSKGIFKIKAVILSGVINFFSKRLTYGIPSYMQLYCKMVFHWDLSNWKENIS